MPDASSTGLFDNTVFESSFIKKDWINSSTIKHHKPQEMQRIAKVTCCKYKTLD